LNVEEKHDGFIINGGGEVQGRVVDSHGDHRLAMALAVAGLAAQGALTVENSEIISESYPGFSEVLLDIGADVRFEW
jgi:3-phosphoshikimate 1-carboxyvinyltransferase